MTIEMNAGTPQLSQHERLTQTAQKWVAQTFYGTMLKQMRESPFRSDLFEGGRGGQAFAQMFDQQIAERISRGAGGKLADAIVKKIERGRVTDTNTGDQR